MANIIQKQQEFMLAYQACHEPFIKYCSALAYGYVETEDLVQDVLLSAFTHWEKIKRKDQLLHYLIRAARNRSISLRRKYRHKVDLANRQAASLQAKGISPEMVLDIQLLYWAINQRSASQKEALVLFEITGFSIKEIASIQKSSLSAVKTRLSRARQNLKKEMDKKASSHSILAILSTAKTILL